MGSLAPWAPFTREHYQLPQLEKTPPTQAGRQTDRRCILDPPPHWVPQPPHSLSNPQSHSLRSASHSADEPVVSPPIWAWAHRQVCENLEGATEEVDKVHEVSAGSAVRLRHAPLVVGQLDELIYLLVEFGVDLTLCWMPGILKTTTWTSQHSCWNSVNFNPFIHKSHQSISTVNLALWCMDHTPRSNFFQSAFKLFTSSETDNDTRRARNANGGISGWPSKSH